jgi:hypothetical protein
MRNSALFALAIGLLTFVLGFSYGDLLGARYDFHLNEWQGLAGTLVAIVAAGLAYIGVWTTQRVSVMTKEQERIDAVLPGLRQTHDLLDLLIEQTDLPPKLRYVAHQAIRSVIRPQDGENYEAIVTRMVPLADPELRRDIGSCIVPVSHYQQAPWIIYQPRHVDLYSITLRGSRSLSSSLSSGRKGRIRWLSLSCGARHGNGDVILTSVTVLVIWTEARSCEGRHR